MTRTNFFAAAFTTASALLVSLPSRGEEPAKSGADPVKLGSLVGLEDAATNADPSSTHPLMPMMQIAREGYRRMMNDVRDYTCLMVKRERVGNRIYGPEKIFTKIRHERVDNGKVVTPRSIYMKFQSPAGMKGREVLFVKSEQESDRILVKKGGKRLSFLTFTLAPNSRLAMNGNRYPITEFGLKRLIERMIIFGEHELTNEQCKVNTLSGVDVDGRVCTCVEVFPKRRKDFDYHAAKIFIDDELRVPIRFESYGWPSQEDDQPQLLEEYTYRNLTLNVGLTEADFRRDHPEYGFR